MPARYRLFALIALPAILLDQLAKAWIRSILEVGDRQVVIPDYFNLVHAQNPGAAFSLLRDAEWRRPFFLLTATVAFVVILGWVRKLEEKERPLVIALALIFAGAMGNFIDRLFFEVVTDFLQVQAGVDPLRSWLTSHLGDYRWPAFNVADSCISVGTVLFVWFGVIKDGSRSASSPARVAGGA